MKALHVVLVCVTVVLTSGCSSIKVYRPNASTEAAAQGIKVYAPKPYIVVARAGDGGKVISVTPVMLPDLADPQIIRQTAGLGKANLTLGIEGGLLKQYGGDVDTKIPETMKELGGLATSYGALVKSISEAAKLDQEAAKIRREAVDTNKITGAAQLIASARGLVVRIVEDTQGDIVLSKDQNEGAVAVTSKLKATESALRKMAQDPNVDIDQDVLDQYAKTLLSLADAFDKIATGFPAALVNKYPTITVGIEIRAGAGKIASVQAASPVFDLYEVDNSSGKTLLNKVQIP